MNLLLLLAAFGGLLTGVGVDVNRRGWKNVNWLSTGLKSALVSVPMIAASVWLNTDVFLSVLIFIAVGAGYLAVNNNVPSKN